MTREDLVNVKEKLSKLSLEEQKKRDIYLRQIALGELQGPMLGYPSIDKPWMKYYEENALYAEYLKQTVYSKVYENNKDHQKDLAIEFFGSKINFQEFFKKISQTVKALEEYGVKKGDYVTICAAGIPETAYVFYAISKLGAVGNFMPPYLDKESMIKNIKITDSKILIVMDSFYEYVISNAKEAGIKNVIVLPTLNSSLLRYLKKGIKIDLSKETSWNQFIKDGSRHIESEIVPYEKNSPLAVVYSSGTSGYLKGIVLSNDSFQNSINAYMQSGVEISRRKKMYQIIPPWASTGLSTALHLPLSAGSSVFMDPRYDSSVFTSNIIKHKINYTIATTSMYSGFLDEENVRNKIWPSLQYPFEGGEKINAETIQSIEKVFREHKSTANLRVGYGQCECGATIATETANTDHSLGSVGIPLPGVNIKIVDDNFNELSYGERGYILVNTPCGMLEYLGNSELTNDYFFFDEFGTKWSKTGDIGYIDANGNLFVCGRARDFTLVNNKKIYNFDIKSILMSCLDIEDCEVLPKANNDGDTELVVHIVFRDASNKDIRKRLLEIQELIYSETKDKDCVPYIFKIRNEFPAAKSSKRDINKLKAEEDGFIYLDKYRVKELVREKH